LRERNALPREMTPVRHRWWKSPRYC